MPATTKRQMQPHAPPSAWRRLAWFAGLWAAGVIVVAAIAYALRAVIFTIG